MTVNQLYKILYQLDETNPDAEVSIIDVEDFSIDARNSLSIIGKRMEDPAIVITNKNRVITMVDLRG